MSSDDLETVLVIEQVLDDLDEEESIDEDEEETLLAAFALGGAAATALARQEARKRRYLVRGELLPDPRRGTPWQQLYSSRSDRAFITTMGIDVDTFDHILEGGFRSRWDTTPIERPDTQQSVGEPRPQCRSLDAPGALGLVLHWLSSSMRETMLQLIFALTPSTANRYLHTTLHILSDTLLHLPDAKISWPASLVEFEEYSNIISRMYPLLVGAFATLDGLKLPVQVSHDQEIENATYNGWLHDHFIGNILTFCPKRYLIHAILNAPGSWHDAKIARELYNLLLYKTPPGYYVVADTAFPRSTPDIQRRIHTPLKSDDVLPTDAAARHRLQLENRQLLSCRQSAEWGMRDIQGSFGRLRVPLPIEHNVYRLEILTLVVRMHQLRVRRVGISEIHNTYIPIWRDGDDLTELWFNWERMQFGDIRRKDRVSKFHRIVDN